MAIGQTKHEWCRLVARAIKTDVGTAGLLIGLFVKADGDPHPVGTICAKSAEGSIAVEVRVNRINLLRNDRAHPPVTRRFVLSAFAGDFKRSARSRSSVVDSPDSRRVPAEMLPQPLTLCMGPAEQLIVSLQGWEENYRREREDMLGAFPIYMRSVLGGLDHNDYILGGVTHAFSKVQQLAKDGELPVVQQSNIEQMKDLEVAFQVNARAIGCVPQPATH